MRIRNLAVFSIVIVLLLSFLATSASTSGYVTDGLVALYGGNRNQGNKHDKQSTIWKDLSGNNNDISLTLGDNVKWEDNGLFLDTIKVYLPDVIKDTINGNEFTAEVVLNNFTSKADSFNTFLNSTNDNFALYRRVPNDVFMFKNNSNARPVTPDGTALDYLSSSVTITVTYKVGGKATLYVNGEKQGATDAVVAIGANDMYICIDHPQKKFSAVYEGLRFYNRELTAEEVAQNYEADLNPVNPATGVVPTFFYMTVALGLAGNAFKRKKEE